MRLNLSQLLSKFGIALMVFIALAIQPTQMALASTAMDAIKAARAEAAQASPTMQASTGRRVTPQDICPSPSRVRNSAPGLTMQATPSVICPTAGTCGCPGSPSPSPTPTPAKLAGYYLSHGIGDATDLSTTTSSNYFGPILPNFLGTASSGAQNSHVMVQTPAVDWRNKDIPNQAVDLGSLIQNSQSNVQNIVLIGHSQGGLRSREYIQHLNSRFASVGASKVVGLVTIGSPNYGAPIVNNAYPVAGFLTITAATALTFFAGYAVTAFTGGAYAGAKALLNNLIGAGGPNMAPGSPFLNSLNTPGASGFAPIPSNVATLQVLGDYNEFDALVGTSQDDTRTKRQVAATVVTLLAGAAWAVAWFFGLSIPAALAFTALAALLWALPSFWKNSVVGSSDGDGVVPFGNQPIRRANVNIGGRPDSSFQLEQVLPNGMHVGPLSENNDLLTQRALKTLLDGLKLPCNTCTVQ